MDELENMPFEEVINRIITLTDGIRMFWTSARGWAPIQAAQLLSRSRLDWQVSLSKCLKIWISSPSLMDEPGSLILAWANLGCLVEGALMLFLSVWYESYREDVAAIRRSNNRRLVDPDFLHLGQLRGFFNNRIWRPNDEDWDDWIGTIQDRRNAIHAYRNRHIGTFDDFFNDVRRYLEFLRYINARLPYPDDVYIPREV